MSTMRSMLLASMLLSITPRLSHAQKDETLQIYHGTKGKTFAFAWNADGRDDPNTRTLEGRRIRRLVSPGDSICIEVTNANKIFYEYSLISRRDSTPLNLGIPELENFRAVVGTAAGLKIGKNNLELANTLKTVTLMLDSQSRGNDIPRFFDGRVDPSDAWWTAFAYGISSLGREVTEAQAAMNESDTPEAYGLGTTGPSSFEIARRHVLNTLASGTGQFNDAKLDESMEKMYESAKAQLAARQASPSADALTLLEALRSYAKTLVKVRDSIRSAFSSTDGQYIGCHLVGDNPETLQLRIAGRDKNSQSRSTGDGIAIVSLIPTPAWIRVVPVLYSLPASLRQEFELKEGHIALKDDGSNIHLTPGLFLGARVPLPKLELEQVNVRLGVGVNGIGSGSQELRGLFWGGYVSFRDYLGVGVGYGDTRTDKLTSGISAGDPLPAGKELKDLLTHSTKRGLFLLLSLRGIDVTNPLGGLMGAGK